jgi:hypothetical protein
VFFGFGPLPFTYFGFLVPIAFAYIVLVEAAKIWFYRSALPLTPR